MTTYLPPEVQAGLDAARERAWKKSRRLRVQAGEDSHRVVQAWENGFSLRAGASANLRGRVELYDGAKLLSQCLIIASEKDGDLMHFEYKRMTEATDEQPLDFERAEDAPIALIARD